MANLKQVLEHLSLFPNATLFNYDALCTSCQELNPEFK
jgi:hypothetical protein